MKLFVWDFHGTLCTGTEEAVLSICNSVLENFGIERRAGMDDIMGLFGRPWGDYYRHVQPDLPQETVSAMVEMSWQLSGKIAHKYVKPMENVHGVLGEIKGRGGTNIVVSSTSQRRLEEFIEMLELGHLVEHSIGIPHDIETHGSGVEAYKAAKIKEFAQGVFDAIIMTGDRESDVEIGKLLGARTFLLSRNAAKTKADRVISCLSDVLEVYNS